MGLWFTGRECSVNFSLLDIRLLPQPQNLLSDSFVTYGLYKLNT